MSKHICQQCWKIRRLKSPTSSRHSTFTHFEQSTESGIKDNRIPALIWMQIENNLQSNHLELKTCVWETYFYCIISICKLYRRCTAQEAVNAGVTKMVIRTQRASEATMDLRLFHCLESQNRRCLRNSSACVHSRRG